MDQIITTLKNDLIKNSDEKHKSAGERFFREPVSIMGVKSAMVHNISKEHFRNLDHKDRTTVFALCEILWQSGILEESLVACNWSFNVRKQFLPEDFGLFRSWIEKYVKNWAACDTFCNHTVGEFLEMYPEYINELIDWTFSGNRWMKRASAVSLIVPARKGLFLTEIFRISDNLISDTDDMVQKGYGLMLKAASQASLNEVFDYIMSKKNIMPRTAFRYAIEKMPPEMRSMAMKKP